MQRLTGHRRRLGTAIDEHEPRRQAFAVGRSLLAAATLSVLLFNPDTTLFVVSPDAPQGLRCGGFRSVSLWCLAAETGAGQVLPRLLAIATLLVVLSGYRPRWTCLPHWYVTFSLAVGMPLSNGGDRAAAIGAMLFLPICLGDGRTWHWSAPVAPLPMRWRGSSLAAQWCLRGQMSLIYLTAATHKVLDPAWSRGDALRMVAFDAQFGFPLPIRGLLDPLLASSGLIASATWGVVAIQYLIAVAILAGGKWGKPALVCGIALHVAIGLLLGLPGFGLVMIALLLCAGCPAGGGRVAAAPEPELAGAGRGP
jgi:antimicrobial peptide system SdpB family protein